MSVSEQSTSRHKDCAERRGSRLLLTLRAAARHRTFHRDRTSVRARSGGWLAVWLVRFRLGAAAVHGRRNSTTAYFSSIYYHGIRHETLPWSQDNPLDSGRRRATRVISAYTRTFSPLHSPSSLS